MIRALVVIAMVAGCGGGAPKPTAPRPDAVIAVGAKPPDATLTTPTGGKVALAEALHPHARSVVVFYRGFWCETCVKRLGELSAHAGELAQQDVGLVAISADALDDLASLVPKLPSVTLLADPGLVATAAWGLRVPGAEAPSPGTFVIAGGAIAWRHLEGPSGDWPTYAELTAALR
jgi:peroxiredoxin